MDSAEGFLEDNGLKGECHLLTGARVLRAETEGKGNLSFGVSVSISTVDENSGVEEGKSRQATPEEAEIVRQNLTRWLQEADLGELSIDVGEQLEKVTKVKKGKYLSPDIEFVT